MSKCVEYTVSSYIDELDRCLKYLPKEDKEDALSYYSEYIGDMELASGESIADKLGTPKEVAKEIIDNCTNKAVEEQKENKSVKGSGKIIWLVLLGIASLPVSLPLAAALFLVTLVLVLTVFIVLLLFGLAAIAIAFGGFMGFVGMVTAPGIGNKLVCAGIGLALLGLGTLTGIGTVELFKITIRMIVKMFVSRRKD